MFLRPLPTLTALLLGLAASLLVACGGENAKLLPEQRAQDLSEAVEDVRAAAEARDCDRIEAPLDRARRILENLSANVDRNLRAELLDGVRLLEDRALVECAETDTTTTETTPTETSTTTTPTTDTTTTTVPTTTTPTPTTPTTTTPATPTTTTPPADTAPQDGTGGFAPGVGDDTGGTDVP